MPKLEPILLLLLLFCFCFCFFFGFIPVVGCGEVRLAQSMPIITLFFCYGICARRFSYYAIYLLAYVSHLRSYLGTTPSVAHPDVQTHEASLLMARALRMNNNHLVQIFVECTITSSIPYTIHRVIT